MRRLAVIAALGGLLGASTPAAQPARRGTLRTDTLRSQALGARKAFIVYLPPSYASDAVRRYPVAYYLHGLYGGEGDWTRQGRLAEAMDSLVAAGTPEMIVVMPDADDSWYTTWNRLTTLADCRRAPPPTREALETYCVPWQHYDDYVARDLVARVDSAYRTSGTRARRGVAGLSMGGYGAVTLAARYPDVFAAAASHSGVLSPRFAGPRPFARPARYHESGDALRRQWSRFWFSMGPAFGSDTLAWRARDPALLLARLAERARDSLPALYIDTGEADSLVVDENRDFHASLDALGIPHRYAEWPGGHDWSYWRAHVGESLAWLARTLAP